MGARWYEPEDLGPEQDARDEAYGRDEFYVYVLDSDYGHYVGHTANPRVRLPQHYAGEVPSTAGSNPDLAWITEVPFATRYEATHFESALKRWQDGEGGEFKEITGLEPVPWRGWSARVEERASPSPWERRVERERRRKRRTEPPSMKWEDLPYLLLGLLMVAVVGVVVIVIAGIFWRWLVGSAG